jgi:uncharacterized membrane protein
MEALFFTVIVGLVGIVTLVAGVLAVVALQQISGLRRTVGWLTSEVNHLRRRQAELEQTAAPVVPVAAQVPPVAAPSVPAQGVVAPEVEVAAPARPSYLEHIAPPPQSGVAQGGARPAVAPVQPMRDWKPSAAARARDLSDLESKIGQRWIAWVGAVVVFFSAVFFLKYAFQNEWIGPTGQVVIVALCGTLLAGAGSYFIGRKWRIFGQCLMGLGLAILYAAFFSAFKIYNPPVMGQTPAFAFMILVTIAGMALAVLHDAVSMAFLAVLGGILTPVLLSTGQDSRDVLFTYLLILDLGVLAVAFFKNWRLLDTLAMVGSFILYMGWWHAFYAPEKLGPAMAWLGAFYLVFLILPFAYHLARRTPVSIERFIMAAANATFAASYAYAMMRDQYLFTMGFIMLAMAAAYLALGALIGKRLPSDRKSLLGAITLTVTFITLAVPMQLHQHGIMLAWVAEAPVLAVLAYRFKYAPLRGLAFGVLIVGIGRLFLSDVHWPMHHERFVPFENKQFWSAMAVPIAAAVYAIIHAFFRAQETPLDRVLKVVSALGSGLLALIIVNAELHGWLMNAFGPYVALSGITALWALGAAAYFLAPRLAPAAAPWTWGTGVFTLFITLMIAISSFDQTLGTQHLLFLNLRFAACLLGIVATFLLAWEMARGARLGAPELPLSVLFFVVGLFFLLVLLSTEAYTFCHDIIEDETRAGRAGQMSITLVWSIYAAGLLWAGFWKRWRALRWSSLALFGIAAVKLALVDLAFLEGINRIIAFFVLGMLMLAASYLYHRLEKRLTAHDKGDGPPPSSDSPAAPSPAGGMS